MRIWTLTINPYHNRLLVNGKQRLIYPVVRSLSEHFKIPLRRNRSFTVEVSIQSREGAVRIPLIDQRTYCETDIGTYSHETWNTSISLCGYGLRKQFGRIPKCFYVTLVRR